MNDNIICTVLDFKDTPSWYYDKIEPRLKKYATSCSADYKCFTADDINSLDPSYRPPSRCGGRLRKSWNKLLLLKFFINSQYKKMLFLDHDQYICRYDYNIFDTYNQQVLGSSCKWLLDFNDKRTDPSITNFAKLNGKSMLYTELKKLKYQINGGLFAVDQYSAKILHNLIFTPDKCMNVDCKPYDTYRYLDGPAEQPYLTYKILETEAYKLTPPWVHTTPENKRLESVFLHFVGPRKKWLSGYNNTFCITDNMIINTFKINKEKLYEIRNNI